MTEKKENRMGVMPIGKLLFSMSTPTRLPSKYYENSDILNFE